MRARASGIDAYVPASDDEERSGSTSLLLHPSVDSEAFIGKPRHDAGSVVHDACGLPGPRGRAGLSWRQARPLLVVRSGTVKRPDEALVGSRICQKQHCDDLIRSAWRAVLSRRRRQRREKMLGPRP